VTSGPEHALFVGAPRAQAFVEQLSAELSGVRVASKADDPLSRLIDRALRVITLGGQRSYLDGYTTVLGRTIYVPTTWNERSDLDRLITLRHEAVHLRQFERYGRLFMSLLYLLPLFPFGLAWGRARIEWEAYRETLRATAELRGMEAARDPRLHAHIVHQFTSAAYGYMWPFPRQVQRWIDTALDELELERRA
jgi:hypothetical protein